MVRVKERLIEIQEERRAAAIAAAAKKKPAKKGATGQKEEEPEIIKDEIVLPPIFKLEEPKNYDIFNPKDYLEILKEQIPRPFIFGPIDFVGLDQEPFPVEYWHNAIIQ